MTAKKKCGHRDPCVDRCSPKSVKVPYGLLVGRRPFLKSREPTGNGTKAPKEKPKSGTASRWGEKEKRRHEKHEGERGGPEPGKIWRGTHYFLIQAREKRESRPTDQRK